MSQGQHMKQQVKVRVYGIQNIDGEEQQQEVVTGGEYYEQNGKRFLLYEEEVQDAHKTVRTIVKESNKGIEVVKNGYISVKMSFSEGASFNSPYSTPMGSVSLHTVTKTIKKEDRQGGFLWELQYTIYMDDQYVGENTLGMEVQFI